MTEQEPKERQKRPNHYPQAIKDHDLAKRLFDHGVDAYQQFLKIHEISYRPAFNVYSDSNAKINAAQQRLREQRIVKGLTKLVPDVNWIVEIRRETIVRMNL